jgi:peptidoglycan/LPS O-acetylase OafA/YrhL
MILDLSDYAPILSALSLFSKALGICIPVNPERGPDLALGLFLLLAPIAAGWRFLPLEIFPLQFLGVISYSIYLWHTLILTIDRPELVIDGFGTLTRVGVIPSSGSPFAYFLVYIPAIIFLSSVSYALIERTFLNLKSATVISKSL